MVVFLRPLGSDLDQTFIPGCVVPTRIIGAMEMIDGGETDTKLIKVGGQAVLGRQIGNSSPWLTERYG